VHGGVAAERPLEVALALFVVVAIFIATAAVVEYTEGGRITSAADAAALGAAAVAVCLLVAVVLLVRLLPTVPSPVIFHAGAEVAVGAVVMVLVGVAALLVAPALRARHHPHHLVPR
jgi:hypothetical protein